MGSHKQELRARAEFFFLRLAGRTVPQFKFSQISGIARNESSYEALLLGLQVNIDKVNSRRYDVIR